MSLYGFYSDTNSIKILKHFAIENGSSISAQWKFSKKVKTNKPKVLLWKLMRILISI